MLRKTVMVAALLWFAASAAQAQVFQPSDAQVSAARAAATAYWNASDAGDSSRAYAAVDDQFRQTQTQQDFTAVSLHFAQVAGPLVQRRVENTEWHQDSAAEGGSVYAAFDFVARYQNIDRYCGFVIVRQARPNGPFAVSRVDETYLDNAAAQAATTRGQSPDDVWAHMAAGSCPGWQPSWTIPAPASAPATTH